MRDINNDQKLEIFSIWRRLSSAQQRYEMLSREHALNEQVVNELIKHLAGLYEEHFYEEALKIADLAIKASHDLPISIATKKFLVHLWHMPGHSLVYPHQ